MRCVTGRGTSPRVTLGAAGVSLRGGWLDGVIAPLPTAPLDSRFRGNDELGGRE